MSVGGGQNLDCWYAEFRVVKFNNVFTIYIDIIYICTIKNEKYLFFVLYLSF